VTVPFFFEGLPHHSGAAKGRVEFPSADYVSDFLANSGGLSLHAN
jgi:hypothetical protein